LANVIDCSLNIVTVLELGWMTKFVQSLPFQAGYL